VVSFLDVFNEALIKDQKLLRAKHELGVSRLRQTQANANLASLARREAQYIGVNQKAIPEINWP
jgi:indole-3-glycerol phosphate synthase